MIPGWWTSGGVFIFVESLSHFCICSSVEHFEGLSMVTVSIGRHINGYSRTWCNTVYCLTTMEGEQQKRILRVDLLVWWERRETGPNSLSSISVLFYVCLTMTEMRTYSMTWLKRTIALEPRQKPVTEHPRSRFASSFSLRATGLTHYTALFFFFLELS